jgi:hypothetical protein
VWFVISFVATMISLRCTRSVVEYVLLVVVIILI